MISISADQAAMLNVVTAQSPVGAFESSIIRHLRAVRSQCGWDEKGRMVRPGWNLSSNGSLRLMRSAGCTISWPGVSRGADRERDTGEKECDIPVVAGRPTGSVTVSKRL
eukprot:IDg2362t1